MAKHLCEIYERVCVNCSFIVNVLNPVVLVLHPWRERQRKMWGEVMVDYQVGNS